MQKISTKDLLSLENYSQEREKIRKNLIEIKKDRKIQIGGNVTLLFENNRIKWLNDKLGKVFRNSLRNLSLLN